MKTVVGIDISKNYFDALINNKVERFQNNKEGIIKFVKLLPNGSHCVMESTSTYCYSLAKEILKSGNFAYVVNPLKISYFIKMGLSKTKTDRRDAVMITKFGEMNLDELSPYHFASEGLESAKVIQTALEQLKKQRTALLNQLEAMEHYPFQSKEAIKALKKVIRVLEQQIKELEAEAKKLVKTEHKDMVANISSIKGIGEDTAVFLISITKGFFSFENARQLSSFFGCSPRIVESGSSVRGRGAISKLGHANVRARLYMCAMTAIRYNTACKELFIRLVQKGKPKKVALLAVVNKMIHQVFAVMSKNEPYVDGYHLKSCA